MSWKTVGSFSRRAQFNYLRAPDATVDNASVTHTIGGQLDLGEWSDASDNTRQLDIKNRIINVCDPSGPQDVATKQYVDDLFAGRVGTGDGGTQTIAGPVGPQGPAGVAGPIGQTGPFGPIGPRGIPGEAGPIGRDGAFVGRGDTGPLGPIGPIGVTGSSGIQGERGPTGTRGVQGLQGSSGLLAYLNPAGDFLDNVDIADSFLMSTTNVNFTTRVMDFTIDASETKPLVYFWNKRSNITEAQTSIPGGEVWTMNLFAKPVSAADIQNVEFKFKLFRITSTTTALATSVILDTQSTAMPPVNLPENVLSVGTVSSSVRLSSNGIALYQMTLEVPFTDVSDPNTYLQVQIYATNVDTERTRYCKLYFQNTSGGYEDPTTLLTYASTYSYVRTTFGAAGIQGAQGAQGNTGPQGPQGNQGGVGPPGPAGSQGNTGSAGPAGIQGPRGDAAGPLGSVQYKHAITGMMSGSQYFAFDASDNNGTVYVPSIVMSNATAKGSLITPHRVDVNDLADTSVAPVYLTHGAYGDTNYSTGFMTVGLKYNGGTQTVSKPSTPNEVNFGFQTAYGLQTVGVGVTAIGPNAAYAYRLSRRNGGSALSAMEILQNGSRMNLNADRFLLSASSGNSNGAQFTLTDVAGPAYDASSSFMLSTQVWNKPLLDEPYPVWMSCHQGTSTYGNTSAMIKMSPDEVVFMGAVKFMKGMSMTGTIVNMDTDLSGTINIGAQSSFINIGNGAPITTLNIGNGLTTGTLNLGTGMTTGTINIGTASNGGGSVINLGGPGDTINMMGTTTYINTTNLDVSDNLITLNKGASFTSTTIRGAGMQLTRLNNAFVDTYPGWVKTDLSGATMWEIVPPNHPVDSFKEIGNGLAVCNIANARNNDNTYPVVGLRTTLASSLTVQNLVLQRDGNVGIGYSDACSASVSNFPSSKLHIESTTGNQITLGNGGDNGGANYVRTFISSPLSGNANVILAVGRGTDATARADTPALLTRGFRFAYVESDTASSSTLTLACTQGGTTFASPNLTFFRSDGTALFTSNTCIDTSKYFRMYNSAFSVVSQTANLTFEVNGSNGAMRIGNMGSGGNNIVADASAGSLTLGSHIVLNADSTVVPTNANRPSGRRGMVRYNTESKNLEVHDGGTLWNDVGYYSGVPVGGIIAYPSSDDSILAPSFLPCDSRSVNRSAYSELFSIIGTTFGSINGSEFNLPNMKGKVIVNYDSSDTTFNAINKTGGAKTHQLAVNEIPSHNHSTPSVSVTGSITFTGTASTTGQNGSHNHKFNDGYFEPQGDNWSGGGGANESQSSGYAADRTLTTQDAGLHGHSYTPSGEITHSLTASGSTTGDTGGGQAHNNLQPYIVMNYYIKVYRKTQPYTNANVSDIRIKTNVTSIDAQNAWKTVLSLKPSTYEYKSKHSSMSPFEKQFGFIAQHVKSIIPDCVSLKTEYIPNIQLNATLASYVYNPVTSASQSIITFETIDDNKSVRQLIEEQVVKGRSHQNVDSDDKLVSDQCPVKLRIFNSDKLVMHVTCTAIVSDWSLLLRESLPLGKYFVFGQEVDDYHYMNNEAVYVTVVAAFQEMSKQYNDRISRLEQTITMLTATSPQITTNE
jgi:microcystin-dependent protein